MTCFNGAVTSSLRKDLTNPQQHGGIPCFNGAVTSSLRKDNGRHRTQFGRTCFNGAVTSSLRKGEGCVPMEVGKCELQWGRNFIVTESTGRHLRRPVRYCCFNGAVTSSLRKVGSSCGCSARYSRFNGAVTSSLRKGITWWLCTPGVGKLQWGRNFIVTERSPSRIAHPPHPRASMGP